MNDWVLEAKAKNLPMLSNMLMTKHTKSPSNWGWASILPLLAACSGSGQASSTSAEGGAFGSIGGQTSNGGSAGGGAAAGGTTSVSNSTGGAAAGAPSATGGVAATGGAAATGATFATGGAIASTGGTKSTGGTNSATGGSVASGGSKAAGGSALTGGALATGGVAATGGSKATGGAVTTGGAKGTGGATPTGGAAPAGGNKATGGNAATGGSSGNSCSTPPAPSPLVGWAAVSGNGTTTTTGGGNATPTTVTTLAALQSAASGTNAAVIYVSGVLPNGRVTVGSNKTIVGLCGAEIHGHVELSRSVNVIIRNIKIVGYGVGNCALDPSYDSSVGCSSGDDAVTVQNSAHHIWFDHCDIADGTDGNLDITKESNYVTVSWTRFHYTPRTDNSGSDSTGASGHRYSNLVGGSDTDPDSGLLNITWHHDWWADNVYERQPQVRFGKNHLFNNLWTSAGDNYCVRAVIDAHILIENSVFSGVRSPHLFYSTAAQQDSNITAGTSNIYTNTSGTSTTGGGGAAFTAPPYTYTMDAASGVQAAVQSGAGPK